MRLDWEIAKRGWRRYAAYPGRPRGPARSRTRIFGFMQAYVLLALYRHRTDVGGYDVGDAVTYVWLAQALIMTVYVFGWDELALRIRDGSIATDLSRPLNPQRYWLAFDLGRAPYHFIFRGIPPFLIGALVFELHYPSPLDAVAFVVQRRSLPSSSASASGSSTTRRRSGSSTIRGVVTLSVTVVVFFSGMTLPLAFFPNWLETFAHALPFASIIQTPIDVWLGKHTGATLVGGARAAGWPGRWRCSPSDGSRSRAATRKLVVQGG